MKGVRAVVALELLLAAFKAFKPTSKPTTPATESASNWDQKMATMTVAMKTAWRHWTKSRRVGILLDTAP